MRDSDEARLVDLASRLEPSALSEFYRRYVDQVYRYIVFRVGDSALAEDLTSDVFLRALNGLTSFQYRGIPVIAWLYRIARGRVVDHMRQSARRQQVSLETLSHAGQDAVEDGVMAQQEIEAVRAVFSKLTDEQQQVLVLRFVEGFSLELTATSMGKTPGAIKAMQHRALRALARQLSVEMME